MTRAMVLLTKATTERKLETDLKRVLNTQRLETEAEGRAATDGTLASRSLPP